MNSGISKRLKLRGSWTDKTNVEKVVRQSIENASANSAWAQRGSALVECGICIALVAVVCIAATAGLGRSISNLFQGAVLNLQGGGFEGIPGGGEGEG
jgi:Flp pilus assembly pilin Flp